MMLYISSYVINSKYIHYGNSFLLAYENRALNTLSSVAFASIVKVSLP